MREELYIELIEDFFDDWCGNCTHLVQDHERCLRTPASLDALAKVGLALVDYPRVSQDFNAIENAWHLLKERLFETLPQHLETREEFIKRLKAAVAWINRHRGGELWHLSTNQKERADDCLAATPPGGRTKW